MLTFVLDRIEVVQAIPHWTVVLAMLLVSIIVGRIAGALLKKRLGFAGLFVTHDVVEALLLGDRVGVMHHGRLVQLAPGRELVRAPVDDYVAELVRGPLRQAREVEALLDGRGLA